MQPTLIAKSTEDPQTNKKSSGLTGDEARRRLQKFGFNEPVIKRRASAVGRFLLLFAEPLIVILLIASAISAFVGDWVNAGIVFVMVLLGVSLNFIQTSRSQRAAESLRKAVSLTATVLRDGAWREIPRREVVPNDVIRLAAGDLVPADAHLIDSRDLHVQEAALRANPRRLKSTRAGQIRHLVVCSWELLWSAERQLRSSRRRVVTPNSAKSPRNSVKKFPKPILNAGRENSVI